MFQLFLLLLLLLTLTASRFQELLIFFSSLRINPSSPSQPVSVILRVAADGVGVLDPSSEDNNVSFAHYIHSFITLILRHIRYMLDFAFSSFLKHSHLPAFIITDNLNSQKAKENLNIKRDVGTVRIRNY